MLAPFRHDQTNKMEHPKKPSSLPLQKQIKIISPILGVLIEHIFKGKNEPDIKRIQQWVIHLIDCLKDYEKNNTYDNSLNQDEVNSFQLIPQNKFIQMVSKNQYLFEFSNPDQIITFFLILKIDFNSHWMIWKFGESLCRPILFLQVSPVLYHLYASKIRTKTNDSNAIQKNPDNFILSYRRNQIELIIDHYLPLLEMDDKNFKEKSSFFSFILDESIEIVSLSLSFLINSIEIFSQISSEDEQSLAESVKTIDKAVKAFQASMDRVVCGYKIPVRKIVVIHNQYSFFCIFIDAYKKLDKILAPLLSMARNRFKGKNHNGHSLQILLNKIFSTILDYKENFLLQMVGTFNRQQIPDFHFPMLAFVFKTVNAGIDLNDIPSSQKNSESNSTINQEHVSESDQLFDNVNRSNSIDSLELNETKETDSPALNLINDGDNSSENPKIVSEEFSTTQSSQNESAKDKIDPKSFENPIETSLNESDMIEGNLNNQNDLDIKPEIRADCKQNESNLTIQSNQINSSQSKSLVQQIALSSVPINKLFSKNQKSNKKHRRAKRRYYSLISYTKLSYLIADQGFIDQNDLLAFLYVINQCKQSFSLISIQTILEIASSNPILHRTAVWAIGDDNALPDRLFACRGVISLCVYFSLRAFEFLAIAQQVNKYHNKQSMIIDTILTLYKKVCKKLDLFSASPKKANSDFSPMSSSSSISSLDLLVSPLQNGILDDDDDDGLSKENKFDDSKTVLPNDVDSVDIEIGQGYLLIKESIEICCSIMKIFENCQADGLMDCIEPFDLDFLFKEIIESRIMKSSEMNSIKYVSKLGVLINSGQNIEIINGALFLLMFSELLRNPIQKFDLKNICSHLGPSLQFVETEFSTLNYLTVKADLPHNLKMVVEKIQKRRFSGKRSSHAHKQLIPNRTSTQGDKNPVKNSPIISQILNINIRKK